jgi:hypothetical protein
MLVKTPYREAVDVLVDEGGETLQRMKAFGYVLPAGLVLTSVLGV